MRNRTFEFGMASVLKSVILSSQKEAPREPLQLDSPGEQRRVRRRKRLTVDAENWIDQELLRYKRESERTTWT